MTDLVPRMLTRHRLIAATVASALAVTACGSDDGDDASGDEPLPTVADTTLPPEPPTSPPADVDGDGVDIELPAEGAVIEMGSYGGFTLQSIAFQSAPQILVTADGQLLEPAAVAAIYPGPLLPRHSVSEMAPSDVAQLVAFLDDEGLLADLDMTSSQDVMVADAPTATLVITTTDDEYRHEAYALGLGGPPGAEEVDPNRIALAGAIEALQQPRLLLDDGAVSDPEPWVPEAYQIVALPVGDLSGYEIEPTVVEWPVDSELALGDAAECTEIAREQVGSLFDDATELTFFTDAGVTYELLARPAYPGRDC